jgi:hypothetical protein
MTETETSDEPAYDATAPEMRLREAYKQALLAAQDIDTHGPGYHAEMAADKARAALLLLDGKALLAEMEVGHDE